MKIAATLDTKGLLCPLPVLKAAKRLREMQAGDVLELVTDDPAAIVDVPHFCSEQGHDLVDQSDMAGGGQRYLIRRA